MTDYVWPFIIVLVVLGSFVAGYFARPTSTYSETAPRDQRGRFTRRRPF